MDVVKQGRGIAIVGAGRLGCALGRALREVGLPVVAMASRNPEHAEAGARFAGEDVRAVAISEAPGVASTLILTVSDDAIGGVARELAAAGATGGVALHTCGALGPSVLQPLIDRGVSCGAMHPMQTIPTPERGAPALRDICWGVTASGDALTGASEIVAALDGELLPIEAGARAAYHAAAVMACNYFIAVQDAALAIMETAGVERGQALRALRPIVDATWNNIQESGPVKAATGPIIRGDVATVRRHLGALTAMPDSVRNLFRAAGLHTLDIARRRGLAGPAADQLEEILSDNDS